MMKSPLSYLALWVLMYATSLELQTQEIQCRPFKLVDFVLTGPDKFNKGLLWEITKDGVEPGYLFGTIHVDDEEIVKLPDVVASSLARSRYFVMETVPSPEDTMIFTTSMFFMDSNRLDELIPEDIFNKTVTILKDYGLSEEMVTVMKPWAAYIVMSYPADMGMVLDLKLMEMARQYDAVISGLETLKEQVDIFGEMDLQDQARILADVVCHYDTVNEDLKIMKSLYLERDLEDLFVYSQRYSFEDNSVYDEISNRLISERNKLMAKRMSQILDKGNAFIAVGAMHLPGEGGILNLLELMNYKITRIY